MFLAEGREHLQNLNLALVRVEMIPASARRRTRSSASRTRSRACPRRWALRAWPRSPTRWRTCSSCFARARTDCPGPRSTCCSLPRPLEQMTSEIETGGTESSDPAALVGACAHSSSAARWRRSPGRQLEPRPAPPPSPSSRSPGTACPAAHLVLGCRERRHAVGPPVPRGPRARGARRHRARDADVEAIERGEFAAGARS